MAQAILNLFPDVVSQFGLLGCGFFSLTIVAGIVAITVVFITR